MCGHPNTAMLRTAVAFVTRATCDRCRMGAIFGYRAIGVVEPMIRPPGTAAANAQ